MKALTALLLLSLTLTSSRAEWRESMERSLKTPLATLPVVSASTNGGYIIVQVRNPSAEPLIYVMRGGNLPQLFSEIREGDKWVEGPYDSCGTGLREYTLAPAATTEIRLPAGEVGPNMRVFTLFRSKDSKRTSLVLLYERK